MLLVNISYCNKCMLIHTYSFYKSIKSIEGYVRPFDYSNIPFKMIPGNTRKKYLPLILLCVLSCKLNLSVTLLICSNY